MHPEPDDECTLVHSRPSGLLLNPQLGRYAGIPGAPTTSYLLSLYES
jgi:hypothetical protein